MTVLSHSSAALEISGRDVRVGREQRQRRARLLELRLELEPEIVALVLIRVTIHQPGMLDREPQERLGALLVIGFGPEVVVGLAALGCMQLFHPAPDAAGDQSPQLRPALLDEDPHRIPQRV